MTLTRCDFAYTFAQAERRRFGVRSQPAGVKLSELDQSVGELERRKDPQTAVFWLPSGG